MERARRLLRTGELAGSCLANEGRGRVLASTSGALWLMSDSGVVFWLAGQQAPMHRRSCWLDGGVPRISPGTRYRVRDAELALGPNEAIKLAGSEMWRASLPARRVRREEVAAGVRALIGRTVDAGRAGFAELLPRTQSIVEGGAAPPGAGTVDLTLKRAGPLVVGLVRAALEGDEPKMQEMADGLVGLGPGLTPSGDDFLGGLLFAVRAWEAAYPAAKKQSGWISTEQYAGRTHLISFTLLDDMANGHAIAPMHELVNGLISGESPEDIHCHVTDLIRVGHSTGGDLLAGLLTGLLIGMRAQEG